jgi:hypothetical protein
MSEAGVQWDGTRSDSCSALAHETQNERIIIHKVASLRQGPLSVKNPMLTSLTKRTCLRVGARRTSLRFPLSWIVGALFNSKRNTDPSVFVEELLVEDDPETRNEPKHDGNRNGEPNQQQHDQPRTSDHLVQQCHGTTQNVWLDCFEQTGTSRPGVFFEKNQKKAASLSLSLSLSCYLGMLPHDSYPSSTKGAPSCEAQGSWENEK